MKKIALYILLVASPAFSTELTLNTRPILEKMMECVKNIHTIRYNLHAIERINGKYLEAYSEIKINTSPREIYLYNPKKKLEILYVEGQNNNNALVNPGKFPFITLNLNPYKNVMRNAQHHTINDLGFQYLMDILKSSYMTDTSIFEKSFINLGIVDFKGQACYKIFNEFADFKYVPHTIVQGETLKTISSKFNCGEYRILEKNQLVKINEPLKAGMIILVPNHYASKTLLYINAASFLPLSITISDNEGLYESYEFSKIQINTTFSPLEFNKSYYNYKFL